MGKGAQGHVTAATAAAGCRGRAAERPSSRLPEMLPPPRATWIFPSGPLGDSAGSVIPLGDQGSPQRSWEATEFRFPHDSHKLSKYSSKTRSGEDGQTGERAHHKWPHELLPPSARRVCHPKPQSTQLSTVGWCRLQRPVLQPRSAEGTRGWQAPGRRPQSACPGRSFPALAVDPGVPPRALLGSLSRPALTLTALPGTPSLPQRGWEELRPVDGEAGQAHPKASFPQHSEGHAQGLQVCAEEGGSGSARGAPRELLAEAGGCVLLPAPGRADAGPATRARWGQCRMR